MSQNNVFTTPTHVISIIALLSLATMSFILQAKPSNASAFERELGLHLDVLSAKVDSRVGQMKLISKGLANDTHIHAWVNDGFSPEHEALLIEKLGFYVNQYGFTSVSFADKNTHKYWNHEGFLRVLTPETDTWYFAYLASKNQDLVSVYYDQNKKRVDLYVNYQQTQGSGLSGIATSFDGMLDMLNNSVFAETGTVYIVDEAGIVQVQSGSAGAKRYDQKNVQTSDADDDGTLTLQALVGESIATSILSTKTHASAHFKRESSTDNMVTGARFMPSMGWYMVAQVPIQ